MRIGELSKKYRIERRAIDYYTSVGIIPYENDENSDYREYGKAAEEIVKKIMILREMDFSARKIKEILENPMLLNQTTMEMFIKVLKDKKKQSMQYYDDCIRYAQEHIRETKNNRRQK